MIWLENQLTTLDEQLSGYEPAKRWAIILFLCGGIFYMSWMFLISPKLSELWALQEETLTLQERVINHSPAAYQMKISHIDRQIGAEKQSTADLAARKRLLYLQMSDTQELLFDNRRYAKMLQRLLQQSVRMGLKIESMESVDTDKTFSGKVKELKTLTIVGAGRFPAIAEFLAFIEGEKKLVKIQSVTIRSEKDDPRFSAVIVFMGVKL